MRIHPHLTWQNRCRSSVRPLHPGKHPLTPVIVRQARAFNLAEPVGPARLEFEPGPGSEHPALAILPQRPFRPVFQGCADCAERAVDRIPCRSCVQPGPIGGMLGNFHMVC